MTKTFDFIVTFSKVWPDVGREESYLIKWAVVDVDDKTYVSYSAGTKGLVKHLADEVRARRQ